MPADPIKAALVAAVEGYDAARVAVFHGSVEKHGMSAANKQHIEPLIAAAVVAFLRALPDTFSKDGHAFWCGIPREESSILWIAAAVARAAQEARDDR